MHVCICECACVPCQFDFVCVFGHMCVFVRQCMCLCLHAHLCMFVCLCVCVREISVYVCLFSFFVCPCVRQNLNVFERVSLYLYVYSIPVI